MPLLLPTILFILVPFQCSCYSQLCQQLLIADVYLIDNTLQVITVERTNIFGDCIAALLNLSCSPLMKTTAVKKIAC